LLNVDFCFASPHADARDLFSAAWVITALAQPVFTGTEIFPPDEFAARRTKVLAAIGDGVAILQGTTERPGEQPLRQSNQFFYLTGVVEPRAIAVIDGRTKKTTIFLQPFNERREQRMYGPGLHPGEEAARALGVDAVLSREEFATSLPDLVRGPRAVYTPFRPEVLGEASTAFVTRYRNNTSNSLGHSVGMEVHDVRMTADTLETGFIFTIEPAMQIEDEHLGIRLEDMILITDTGYENLSVFVPIEIDAIERLMAQPGLSDYAIR
jgi:Xaa-Pro aminopeptidase